MTGWPEVPLGELGTEVRESLTPDVETRYIHYSVPSFTDGEPAVELGSAIKSNKRVLQEGDILICRINPRINRVWTVGKHDDPIIGSTEWVILRPPGDARVLSAFLLWYLRSPRFRHLITGSVSGVTGSHTRAKAKDVLRYPVPVPPLDEQHAIVDATERMLSKVSAAEGFLTTSNRRLLKLHDSSLRQAVYGNWPDTPQLGHAVSEAWPRTGRGVLTPEVPEDIDLPSGWRWAALDQIAEVQSGAAKSRKLDGAEDCVERPYLSVANVQRGHLQLNDVGTMWVKKSKLDALTLQPDDILFNEGGDKDKLGRGWIWEGQISGCVHQNHVFRARLLTEDIDPRWVSHWGNVFGRWWFYARGNQTTGIASINKTVLRALPVAVPPRDVQQYLLEQIDKSASLVAAVREALRASETRAAALRRSILKAAFEGRLTHNAADASLRDFEQVPA